MGTGSATLQQPNLHSFFYKSLIIHRFIHSAASFWMTHIHRYTHTHIGEERKTNREENAQTTISKKRKNQPFFSLCLGFSFSFICVCLQCVRFFCHSSFLCRSEKQLSWTFSSLYKVEPTHCNPAPFTGFTQFY